MDTINPQEAFGMYIAHIGLNGADEKDAYELAEFFSRFFNLPIKDMGKPSYFAGTLVEVMKGNGRGTNGHIGFHVDNLPEAEAYFRARGLEINEESRVLDENGNTFLVYFKQEICGFALHLTVAE